MHAQVAGRCAGVSHPEAMITLRRNDLNADPWLQGEQTAGLIRRLVMDAFAAWRRGAW